MQEAITQVLEFLKVIMPWLTGGLAGAILTYMLNRRLARRSQPRIAVKASSVNYALPKYQESFRSLKVSYDGVSYDELSYYEIEIENVSQRTVDSAPFIFTFSEGARILKEDISSEPVRHEVLHDQVDLEPHQHRYTISELHSGDSVKIRLLVQGRESLAWYFRGSDEVDIVFSGDLPTRGVEEELRFIVLWIALYVTAGAVPIVSEVLRGGLIIGGAPYVYRLFSRWRAEARRGKQGIAHGPIIVSDSGSVSVTYDPRTGASIVAADFDQSAR